MYFRKHVPRMESLNASSLPMLLSNKSTGFSWLKYVDTVSTLGLRPLLVLLESTSSTVSQVFLFWPDSTFVAAGLFSMPCLLLNMLKLLRITRAMFDGPFVSPLLPWKKKTIREWDLQERRSNTALNAELTFLLFFFVLPLDDFLCATLIVELLTVTDADLLPEVTCNSSSATLTSG